MKTPMLHKKIFSLFAITLIFSLVFACQGGVFEMSASEMESSLSQSGGPDMPCCASIYSGTEKEKTINFSLFNIPTNPSITFGFMGVFMIAIVEIQIFSIYFVPRLYDVIWKLYFFLLNYLRRGLLHPKTW